jgi:hypothetical protein
MWPFCDKQAKRLSAKVAHILREVESLRRQGDLIMALEQEILDAVNAETKAVDSLLAVMDENVVTPAGKAAILAAISAETAKVQAVLDANAAV